MNSVFFGGVVAEELRERVMLERIEMITRLTVANVCHEKDREIALCLIMDILNRKFSFVEATNSNLN